jgi:hypothetical protein
MYRTLHWVSNNHEYKTVSQWNAIADETPDKHKLRGQNAMPCAK